MKTVREAALRTAAVVPILMGAGGTPILHELVQLP
jgi:hypothetical protein